MQIKTEIKLTPLEKYNAVINAYQVIELDNGEDRTVIGTETPEEVRDMLITMQNDLDSGFNLSYDIMHKVAEGMSYIAFPELSGAELGMNEFASVYTNARLSYLTQDNQYDITEILKENIDTTGMDIATACAIWYDRKCAEGAEMLRDYILQ